MTEAQVTELINVARIKHGVKIDRYDAKVALAAEEILDREPENPLALEVVRNFSARMRTGIEPLSFVEFLISLPETDEEIAEREQSRAAYLEYYRKVALIGIARDDFEGATRFEEKHGLRSAQILAIPDESLVALGQAARA